MIGKKEDTPLTPDAELLSQTCQSLESKVVEARSQVRSAFAKLTEVLQAREKLLLRRIDVAHSQQLAFIQAGAENTSVERVPTIQVKLESENAVSEAISALGTVSLQGAGLIMLNGDGSFLQSMEDYQDVIEDHIAMFKPLPLDDSPAQKSHETVIRFNHINLPQDYVNNIGKYDIFSTSERRDSCSSQGNCDNYTGDPDADRSMVEASEHPAQVQQWLKQLSAETETEPSVGEPKNFEPL